MNIIPGRAPARVATKGWKRGRMYVRFGRSPGVRFRPPRGYRAIPALHRKRFRDPRVRATIMRLRARVRQRLATRLNADLARVILDMAGWGL